MNRATNALFTVLICVSGALQAGTSYPQGEIHYSDGGFYVGEIKNGLRNGVGVFAYADGQQYNGEWKNNFKSGEGTQSYPNGCSYKGEWFESQRHGLGVHFDDDHFWIEQLWWQWQLKDFSYSIGELAFIGLLTGLKASGAENTYALGVMSRYLQEKAQVSPVNYGGISEELQGAAEFLQEENIAVLSGKILENLKQNHSILIPYGTRHHSMGLKISPGGEVIYLDVFNSGEGLNRHPRRGKYFQTRLRFSLPRGQGTEAVFKKLSNFNAFEKIAEAYEAITLLPGVKSLPLGGDELIWQTAQKSGNCSLEWIFAYLKNTFKNPLLYLQFRLTLLREALATAQHIKFPSWLNQSIYKVRLVGGREYPIGEAKKLLLAELVRKIEKRTVRERLWGGFISHLPKQTSDAQSSKYLTAI